LAGGANKQPLREWQQRVLSRMPVEMKQFAAFQRAADWRPLTDDDCAGSAAAPCTGREYFEAATGDAEPKYYWRNQ
jgi:hypothetical protein